MKLSIFFILCLCSLGCAEISHDSAGVTMNGMNEGWESAVGDGGILDVDATAVNRIGATNLLNTPVALHPFASELWTRPLVKPAEATETVLLDARAKIVGNTPGLSLVLNAPDIMARSPGTFSWIDLKARVEWGGGGTQCSAIVDITNGSQVSVAANFVRVTAIYTAIDTPIGAVISTVRAGASLGYGTRPAFGIGPTFTQFTASVAAAGFTVVLVPPFASTVTLYAFDATVPSTITFLSDPAFLNPLGSVQIPASSVQTVPIPNGMFALQVTNRDAVNATRFTLVYGLAL